MARAKLGAGPAPSSRRGSSEPEGSDAGLAPDVALSVFDFVRTRRCVKVAVVYLALGWALLEFASFAMQGRPAAELVRDVALVVYLCGFFVVLTGAYLVMSGKHPLRTVMIAGLVLASALAGAGIAIVGYSYRGTSDASATTTDDTRPADTPAAAGVVSPPMSNQSSMTLPSSPATSTATPPSSRPVASPSPAATPRANQPVASSPSTAATPRASQSAESPSPAATVAPLPSAGARAAASSADPIDLRLERLVLRFGAADNRLLTVEDTRPVPFLDRYDEPISIRVIPGIRVQVTNPIDRRIQALRLPNPGDVATQRVVVPSGCGELPYDVTATAITRQQVRIGVVLDRVEARAAVERTVQLGRCVGLD